MRNLWKKLSLMFFVIAIVFTNAICVMAKNADEEYEEAFSLLKTLGVISDNIDYDVNALVSREDFAVYTAKLLGVKETNVESRYFVDVPSGSYGTWAINHLTSMGIFSQNSENLFYPENNVDLNQVYKILTTVLGYDMYAKAHGGYPGGYMDAAVEADINLPNGSDASFKNLMILLYRTAQAELYEKTLAGDSFEYTKSGETILSKYHDVYFDEGTIQSISGMTILKNENTEIDTVMIKGNLYDLDIEVFTPDYLGKYVKYFYVDNDEELSVKVMFGVAEEEDIEVAIEDILNISAEKIIYSDKSGRQKTENTNGMLWLYNGTPVGRDLSDTLKNLNKGSVILRDSDDDGEYDCVIIRDYKNFLVSGINTENGIIYNGLEAGGKISTEEYDVINFFDEKGNSLTFDDVSVQNILSVGESFDKKLLNIIVSTAEFNGTLSEIADEDTIVVNETEYKIEPSYIRELEDKKVFIGYVYNYKTDAFGNIAYIYDGESENPMKFGYVLKGMITDTDNGELIRLEVLTKDSEVKKMFLSEKVRIDGVRYKDIKGALEAFPKVEKGNIQQQMIRYELDAEGNIRTVDTLHLNADYENEDNSITVVGDENFSLKWYMRKRIGMLAYVNNEYTSVYAIPKKPLSDSSDPMEYKVGTVNSMLTEDRSIYANIYTASGRSEYADVLVRQYQYSELIKDNEVILVDKFNTVLAEDGEVVKQLKGFCSTGEISINIPDDVDCDNVESGDLVQLRYGVNNQVVGAENDGEKDILILYDYSKYKGGIPKYEDWQGVTDTVTLYALVNNIYYHNYRAETQLSHGTVTEKQGSSIWWDYKNDGVADEMFNIASIPVFVYDSTQRPGEIIYKGTIDDIEDVKTVGVGSKIIMQTNVGIGKAIFVYK